jgi:hypothetical protein
MRIAGPRIARSTTAPRAIDYTADRQIDSFGLPPH